MNLVRLVRGPLFIPTVDGTGLAVTRKALQPSKVVPPTHFTMCFPVVMNRGTIILGEVRNVEISRATKQLLNGKFHDFLAVFALALSKIIQLAYFLDDDMRNYLNFLFKP